MVEQPPASTPTSLSEWTRTGRLVARASTACRSRVGCDRPGLAATSPRDPMAALAGAERAEGGRRDRAPGSRLKDDCDRPQHGALSARRGYVHMYIASSPDPNVPIPTPSTSLPLRNWRTHFPTSPAGRYAHDRTGTATSGSSTSKPATGSSNCWLETRSSYESCRLARVTRPSYPRKAGQRPSSLRRSRAMQSRASASGSGGSGSCSISRVAATRGATDVTGGLELGK